MTGYDSSFFHTSYAGKRVLVLAPHQDDELNIAGSSIQNFVNAGAEVFVAFSTNGDGYFSIFNFTAEGRLSEAVNSLRVLGVDKEHIIVMGYGIRSTDFREDTRFTLRIRCSRLRGEKLTLTVQQAFRIFRT